MSRIVSVALLLMAVTAGCGGAAHPQQVALRGVPANLAHDWEGQAAAIARAASAGQDCRAWQLAKSLRGEVLTAEHKLPVRLRAPLVTRVNALADGLTCTETVTSVVTTSPKPPPKPAHKKDHHDHGHHGHDGGDGGGDK